MKTSTLILAFVLVPTLAAAQAITLDTSELRPGPVTVTSAGDAVTVAWSDDASRAWRATFSLDPARALITSIAAGPTAVVTDARPFYQGETSKRRGGWNAFFDDPASHPDGTRHVQGTFTLRSAKARSIGERVELVFDGMRMGSFEGAIVVHVLSRKPVDSAGSGAHDQRRPTSPTTTTPGSTWERRRSHARQQHALRDFVLRHLGHAEDDLQHGIPRRAPAGPGAPQNARGEDRRRQRRRVSGAAPVFLSARFFLEPRVPLAPIMARPRRHRRAAAARRELAVLPVDECAARTCPAHGRVLSRVRGHTGNSPDARPALHESAIASPLSPDTRR